MLSFSNYLFIFFLRCEKVFGSDCVQHSEDQRSTEESKSIAEEAGCSSTADSGGSSRRMRRWSAPNVSTNRLRDATFKWETIFRLRRASQEPKSLWEFGNFCLFLTSGFSKYSFKICFPITTSNTNIWICLKVLFLREFGGKTPTEAVRLAWKECATDELLATGTWKGPAIGEMDKNPLLKFKDSGLERALNRNRFSLHLF